MTFQSAARRVVTALELQLLSLIRERAAELANSLGRAHSTPCRAEFFFDLLNVHKDIGLQLRQLLAAPDSEFTEDVFGIHRHFNRATGRLDNGFWPRYAIPAVSTQRSAAPQESASCPYTRCTPHRAAQSDPPYTWR